MRLGPTAKIVSFPAPSAGSDSAQGEIPPLIPGPALGKLLKLTGRRVRQLTEQGMPKARHGLYPSADCIGWYITYLRGLNARFKWRFWTRAVAARERKWTYQADFWEAKAAKTIAGFAKEKAYYEQFCQEIDLMTRMLKWLPVFIADRLALSSETANIISEVIEDRRRECVKYRAVAAFPEFDRAWASMAPPSASAAKNFSGKSEWDC